MSNIPTGSPNPDEIHAAFNAVFKDMTPTKEAKVSARERLEPYRGEVVKLRKQGYSWKQIATGMHDPRIAIKTAGSTLKLLFGTRQEKDELRNHVKEVARVKAMLSTIQLPSGPAPAPAAPAAAPAPTKPSLPTQPKPSLPGYARPAPTATGLPPMPTQR